MSLRTRIPGWPALRAMRWSDEQAERYYREGRWERRGLDAMLAEHAARTPDRLACTDGRVSVTWAELDRRARAAAAALLDRGLERGDVVVLRTGNSTDHVVLHYALAAAGLVGYLVPGGASSSAVATAMRRTEARALVTDEPVDPELSGALTAPGLIVAMDDLGDERAVPVADLVSATPRDLPPQDPDDVATLVPTSGTTGTPKIAMRSTNSSLAMARTVVERSGVVPGDVLLVAAPLAGGVGFINAIGTVALTGCTLVMPRDLAPETLLAFVAEHRVTRVATLPTVATRMLNAEAREHTDVTSVKVIQTGGAFLHPGTAAAIERAFGCTAVIVYGAIDVGAPAMVSAADDPPERRHTTVGRVAPGTDLGIMGEDGALLPDGEPGEVVMRGPDTALGYFDDPAATAQVFDAAGWGHLGDLGIVDDEGYLRLVGRLKEIINRGGKKISIAEVEAAVVAWEPIREVAAVGYPDDDLGERCAVFVVTDEPEAVTLDGLKAELARREVPKYLWPERLELADSLPLAPSGKVLRDELRRRLVPAVS